MANRNVARAVRIALIAAGASSAGFHAPGVLAQDAELEQIVVTGSRIARAELESDSPLALVSSADIARTGLVNVGDVLSNLSATDGGGLRPITTATNGSDGASQISMRNLGAERTLILVDGRRWVTDGDATVDLQTIPTSMIERIEVLKDGASAIYGSDAVAGVINIILKKEFEGVQLDAYYGATSKGDGAQDNYGITFGTSNDRGNVVLGLNYSSQEEIMAGDRRISRVPVFGCADPANYSFCGSSAPAYGRFFTGVTADGGGSFGSVTLNPGQDGAEASDFVPWTNAARYNFAPVNYLQQPVERTNIFASTNYDLSDNIEIYGKAVYTKRESSQQLAQVPLFLEPENAPGAVFGNGPQWSIPVTVDNYFNPFGTQVNASGLRMIALGPRNPNYDYDTYGINLGLRGDFELFARSWSWDVGGQLNDGQYDVVGKNYVNLGNLRTALGPSFRDADGVLRCGTPGALVGGANCVPFNLFGGPDLGVSTGRITADEQRAMLDYVGYTQVQTSGNTSTIWYGDMSAEVFDLPAGPLGIAFGTEYRKDEYFNQPDSLVAGGFSSDNFQEPSKGETSVTGYYVEVNVPLLKDMPGAQELTLNVANRWSDYEASGRVGGENVTSDPGSPSTSKIGLTWRPIETLLVRGSWGETFRAPSVFDLYAGGQESYPQANDPCNTDTFGDLTPDQQAVCTSANPWGGVPVGGVPQPNTQIRVLVGGNPTLVPEEGTNWTAGFVWTITDSLDVFVDYWSIELEEAMTTFSAQYVLNQCYEEGNEGYCQFVTRSSGSISDFRLVQFNASAQNVSGVDFGARYALDTASFGTFGFNFDATWTEKDEFQVAAGEDFEDRVGIYDGTPHWDWRATLVTSWSLENLSASWTMRYMSALDEDCFYYQTYGALNESGKPILCNEPGKTDPYGSEGNNNIDDMLYHDLQVSYAAPWNGVFSVGGRNIFGSEPPTVNNSFAHSFDAAYDLPGGAYWYASYKQNF